MSTPYTPVATYHNQINVTVDGDFAIAGEFNPPYQQCADNAAFCKQVIDPLVSGGTITPTNPLTINTELIVPAFECTGDSTFVGQINNTSGHLLTGTFTCTGAAGVTGNLTVGGTVGAAAVSADGDIQSVGGSLATDGASIAPSGNITTAGTLAVSGTTSLTDLNASGSVSLVGSVIAALNFSGIGRVRMRSVRGVDSAAVTYAAHFNLISFPNMASVDRVATIDTGGGPGDWMFLCVDPTAHALTVNFPGGATVTFPTSTLKTQAALFAFISSAWVGPLFQIISDV